MKFTNFLSALVVAAGAATTQAATIPTSFVAQEKPIKKNMTSVDFFQAELYDNAACTGSPLDTVIVNVEGVVVERIKPLKLKFNTVKPEKLVRMHFEFAPISPPGSDLFVAVSSPTTPGFIVGVPGDCQSQEPIDSGAASAHSSVRVWLSAHTAISNALETAVAFTSEDYDTANYHDNVTNPSRLVAPEDGKYLVYVTVMWESSSVGLRRLQLRKNGVDTKGYSDIGGEFTGSSGQSQSTSVVLDLLAGDYMEVIVAHTHGSDLDLFGIADELTYFGMAKID